ncbi:hypothetical protein GE061_013467 [Apolygus lucorum]|uniref:Uncharacterized protein n=1 Tax=Apolygus lucorum TaxID=248454 RepID=A0A6A4JW51_APOLU|nr:hypothetical protein GE061_013467 [Apolygus lucorum]
MKCWKFGRTGHVDRKENKLVTATQAQELEGEQEASECRKVGPTFGTFRTSFSADCDRAVDRYQQDEGFRVSFESAKGGGHRGGRGQGGQGYGDRTFQRDMGGVPCKNRPHQRELHEGDRKGRREYNCLSGSNRTGVRANSKQDNTLNERKAKEAPKSIPEYNLSKNSKGEDLSRGEKIHTLCKKKEEEVVKEEECEDIEIPQRVGKQWNVLDIDIQHRDTGRGGYGCGCDGFKNNQDRPPIVHARERENDLASSSISVKEVLSRHKTAEQSGFCVLDQRGKLKVGHAGSLRGYFGP